MTIEIPKQISAYYEADKNDRSRVDECFTDDAVVVDEGNTYIGRKSTQQWKENSTKKYTYTANPFAIEEEGVRTIVTAHLIGDFPGNPLDLRYAFTLRGDKIASLEITL
ncbi:nuclear transport factor 2 family protein [Mesorhizobium sp. YC-39]|uniref:nuclear transport factor 2 family protein n=1 Tax=unclassified Mesorhizobium TaxID=325217 RepID=UPI0021E749FD|nr:MULTISPECIES: nuclear transport factor 2 family protein [unclassified Mesorhizobium]MCV3205599.1 nuclear transport factor 2 family protein [Mesorhizobium sp. YC-2]MCV3228002.1 nuclear transport factor 2 family protein [Mesorhizobium sp. YC-39]